MVDPSEALAKVHLWRITEPGNKVWYRRIGDVHMVLATRRHDIADAVEVTQAEWDMIRVMGERDSTILMPSLDALPEGTNIDFSWYWIHP